MECVNLTTTECMGQVGVCGTLLCVCVCVWVYGTQTGKETAFIASRVMGVVSYTSIIHVPSHSQVTFTITNYCVALCFIVPHAQHGAGGYIVIAAAPGEAPQMVSS